MIDDGIRGLDLPITNEEVKETLWSIEPFKVFGPDGLHAGLFQHFWLIIGNSVKDEVKRVFASGKVPDFLNRTLITLIFKCKSLETLSNCCPIGLYNSVYKLIAKLIGARIQPLLLEIVSPYKLPLCRAEKG